MSQPALEMAEVQSAAPKECPIVERMGIFKNIEDDGKEPSVGLFGMVDPTQGQKIF